MMMLLSINLFPQKIVRVNARIDTKYHIWTLDSIKINKINTEFYWNVFSKNDTWCYIDSNSYIKCDKKNERLFIKEASNIAMYPDSTILEPFQFIQFTETFDAIPLNTTVIDYYANENFYINGINLESGKFKSIPQDLIFTKSEKDSIELSRNLFNLGMDLHIQEKYEEAIEVFKRVSEIDKSLNIIGSIFYNPKRIFYEDYTRMWIGNCYFRLGQDSIAKTYDSDYKISVPYDRELARQTDSLKILHNRLGRTHNKEDIYIYKKICELDSITFGSNSLRYIESLKSLANLYNSIGIHDSSNVIYQQVLSKVPRETSIFEQAYIYLEISKNYYNLKNYVKAKKYLDKISTLNLFDLLNNTYGFLYELTIIYPIIELNYSTGNNNNTFNIIEKLINLAEEAYAHNPIENKYIYINTISKCAAFYGKIGYYKQAHRLLKRIENIYEDYKDLGNSYMNLYNYEMAEKYFQKALINFKQKNDNNKLAFVSYNYEIASTYNSLSVLESRRKNYQKALEYSEQVLKYKSIKADTVLNSKFYFDNIYVSNHSYYLLKNNRYDEAIKFERYNIECMQNCNNTDSSNLGVSYENLGLAYMLKNEYDTALYYANNAYYILKSDSADISRTLSNLVKLHVQLGDNTKAETYLLELNEIVTRRMKNQFTELTYIEKQRFIEKENSFFANYLPQYVYKINSDTLKKTLYNGVLISKGSLLNSDIELRRIIAQSNNSELINKYKELQFYKKAIFNEMKENSSKAIIDSLSNIVNDIEDSIIIRSSKYGNYMKNQSLTWRDIRNKLDNKSIAIEFINIKLGEDSTLYAALIIKKDYECPKLVKLCEGSSFNNININDAYLTSSLDKLIWYPLKKELKGIKNIYFSVSGILHNFAIELTSSMKKKNMYRLSSTREIALYYPYRNTNKKAALYGGLQYYSTSNDSSANDNKFNQYGHYNSRVNDFYNRGMWFYNLPLTKLEVKNAEKTLNNLNYSCESYIGNYGTEESLKSLSGKDINWLHIASHGGYIQPNKINEHENNYDFIINYKSDAFQEDMSLTHSFILLSGGNATLIGDTIPENSEDGILTAQEIANLNFNKINLVILSACKTALGDISEEGVLGLQRGFKKAGVKSILMSLWDVNDKAAYDYMSLFYDFFSREKNVKYAYDMSHKTMRKRFPNNPEYWAAFVLLDAI